MSNYETITNWFVDLQALIMTEPEFTPLRALFPVEAERMRDHALASRLHERAIQVIVTTYNVEVERLMIRAIDRLQRRHLGLGLPMEVDEAKAVAIASALDEAGHAPLGTVNGQAVADMRAYLETQMVDPGDDRPFCDVAAVKDANVAQYPMPAVVGCPHLAAIASDPTTLTAVAHHLGALPTVLGYTAWWSFAGRSEAREAQFFHFDLDDYRICKLFIYLTDVDAKAVRTSTWKAPTGPQSWPKRAKPGPAARPTSTPGIYSDCARPTPRWKGYSTAGRRSSPARRVRPFWPIPGVFIKGFFPTVGTAWSAKCSMGFRRAFKRL